MCSGNHTVLVLLAKLGGWPLETYWQEDHPAHVQFSEAVAAAFDVRPDRLVTGIDGCGILTYAFPLREVARAFAILADPAAIPADDPRVALARAPRRRSATRCAAYPELVAGTRDRLDTSLMKALDGQRRVQERHGGAARHRRSSPARAARRLDGVRDGHQDRGRERGRSAARGPRRSRRSARSGSSRARRCASWPATTGRSTSIRTGGPAPRRSRSSSSRRWASSSADGRGAAGGRQTEGRRPMSFQGDPYRTLGVAPGASLNEIKSAYRRLVKQYHPDAAGERALPRFLAIQAAYERLVDGEGRLARRCMGPARGPAATAAPSRGGPIPRGRARRATRGARDGRAGQPGTGERGRAGRARGAGRRAAVEARRRARRRGSGAGHDRAGADGSADAGAEPRRERPHREHHARRGPRKATPGLHDLRRGRRAAARPGVGRRRLVRPVVGHVLDDQPARVRRSRASTARSTRPGRGAPRRPQAGRRRRSRGRTSPADPEAAISMAPARPRTLARDAACDGRDGRWRRTGGDADDHRRRERSGGPGAGATTAVAAAARPRATGAGRRAMPRPRPRLGRDRRPTSSRSPGGSRPAPARARAPAGRPLAARCSRSPAGRRSGGRSGRSPRSSPACAPESPPCAAAAPAPAARASSRS